MGEKVVPEELRDVAAVWFPEPRAPFGSGRLIAPGLVLTARHTVNYPPGAPATKGWRVRLLGQHSVDGTWHGDPYEAECIWPGSEKVDLALLKILPKKGERTPRPAFDPVFSSLVGEIDDLEATGYPQATWNTEKVARDYRVRGQLRIETVDWPFAFTIPMADVPKDVAKWHGMSGAVVVGKDPPRRIRVFGAVTDVEQMFSNGKLYVQSITAAFDDPAFRDALKEALGEKPPLVPVRAGSGPALSLDFDPLNSDTEVPSTSTLLRFSPRNPRVSFVGRQHELAALDAFLTAEQSQPFAWWLMTGSGGAGKTRLALQLCRRAYQQGWQAGFLPDGFKAEVAFLNAWCPEVPTLIIADYVLKRVVEIRTLAARLARRDNLPPVRLLLLEREEENERFELQFLGSDQSTRGVIDGARYAPASLVVPNLSEDDIWSLVKLCPWRTDGARLTVTRDEFFARFSTLDSQRRALTAMILADALATSPRVDGLGGLEAELRELLRRERDHLWPEDLKVAGRWVGEAEADVAITFATMIDGLGLPELEAIKEKCGQALCREIWNKLPLCATAIGKPTKEDQPRLRRLEPDLVGEFFALETLKTLDNPFAEPPPGWMPEAAWQVRGAAMANFVVRATQNFPDHTSITRIAITVKGVEESWILAAVTVVLQANDLTQGFTNARELLLAPAQSDVGAAKALANLTIMVTSFEADVIKLSVVAAFLDALAALHAAHAAEPMLREAWAKSVVNFVAVAEDPAGCRALLDALAALHVAHAAEPVLREVWAGGVRNFVYRRAAEDPAGCRALLDALAALHAAHAAEPVLREQWAKGVTNFVGHRAAEDPAGCRALLGELAALYAAHAAEPVLLDELAQRMDELAQRILGQLN